MPPGPFEDPWLERRELAGRVLSSIQPPNLPLATITGTGAPSYGPVPFEEIQLGSLGNSLQPSAPITGMGVTSNTWGILLAPGCVVQFLKQDPLSDLYVLIPVTCRPTTTTTMQPCQCTGTGTWSYSTSNQYWTLTQNNCTTSNPFQPCNPIPPNFVPPGNVTYISGCGCLATGTCSPFNGGGISVTTTTTTNSCTGTALWEVALTPIIGGGASGVFTWCLEASNCSAGCAPGAPPFTFSPNTACGQTVTVPCVAAALPTPCPCTGQCIWQAYSQGYGSVTAPGVPNCSGPLVWNTVGANAGGPGPGGGGFEGANAFCGTDPSCICSPPPYTPVFCGQYAYTPCYQSGNNSNPCQPCNIGTTTTCQPSGNCCNGDCYWQGDGHGGWNFQAGCPGCNCYPPGNASTSSSQVATTSCIPTVTTTTSTTTTTTTRSCSGNCQYLCASDFQFMCSPCNCLGAGSGGFVPSCTCYSPLYFGTTCSAANVGTVYNMPCGSTSSTTTTTSTTTTSRPTSTTTSGPTTTTTSGAPSSSTTTTTTTTAPATTTGLIQCPALPTSFLTLTITGGCPAINGTYSLTHVLGSLYQYSNPTCTSTAGVTCLSQISFTNCNSTGGNILASIGLSGYCSDGSLFNGASTTFVTVSGTNPMTGVLSGVLGDCCVGASINLEVSW